MYIDVSIVSLIAEVVLYDCIEVKLAIMCLNLYDDLACMLQYSKCMNIVTAQDVLFVRYRCVAKGMLHCRPMAHTELLSGKRTELYRRLILCRVRYNMIVLCSVI